MIAFAALLERLVFTPGRNAKIALLVQYFATTPDPDRGFGLAAITGTLDLALAKPHMIRTLIAARTDPVLFAWSYDYVGDLAETVALLWPATPSNAPPPALAELVATLRAAPRADIPALLAAWLDACDSSARIALLKLVTGGLRVGVSARLAKVALAELSATMSAGTPITADAIEEVWHAQAPPYTALFAWIGGRGPMPDTADAPVFRPPMLAHPLEAEDLKRITAQDYDAEWKWDGIRVQVVAGPGGARIYSRSGDDISAGFPELLAGLQFHAVLDGELLVIRNGIVAPFADLQQRLNRKTASARLQAEFPVGIRLYDMLFEGAEDLRPLPFVQRRTRLEAWHAQHMPARTDLSEILQFLHNDALSRLRDGARAAAIEGLMLKRRDSPYLPGRPRGMWWKWKRDPLRIDAVLMYAMRGHGKRGSLYSDYTFGLWRQDEAGEDQLVAVGKAYFGFTDQELSWIDRWVRTHTTARFGPVREVEKSLVLEIAFDGAQRSTRHKSGVALRFPRIARLRTDKPAAEADRLETLLQWLPMDSKRPATSG